jgi:hypothetical protein
MRVAAWVLAGLGVLACGKSRHDAGPASPTAEGGAPSVAGTGGSVTDPTGGNVNGGAGGGSGGTTGGATSGAGTGGSSAGGTGAAGASQLCPGHDGYLTISGTLPGFGTDQTLRNGCSDSLTSSYPGPASYEGGPGEGTAGTVNLVACDEDASLEVLASLQFSRSSTNANGSPALQSGSLSYGVNGAFRTLTITSLTETMTPVPNWFDVQLGSNTGVGDVYEGSFEATDDSATTPTTVHGTFSVCHVANVR